MISPSGKQNHILFFLNTFHVGAISVQMPVIVQGHSEDHLRLSEGLVNFIDDSSLLMDIACTKSRH